MAALRTQFLSIRIMEMLAARSPYSPLTDREILEYCMEQDGRALLEAWILDFTDGFRQRRPPEFNGHELVRECLEDLARAGLVVGEAHKDGVTRWIMVPRWPGRDGGGNSDEGPPRVRDGGDGDGGGGGIGEVLAHPRLFALDVDDFDALLKRATGADR